MFTRPASLRQTCLSSPSPPGNSTLPSAPLAPLFTRLTHEIIAVQLRIRAAFKPAAKQPWKWLSRKCARIICNSSRVVCVSLSLSFIPLCPPPHSPPPRPPLLVCRYRSTPQSPFHVREQRLFIRRPIARESSGQSRSQPLPVWKTFRPFSRVSFHGFLPSSIFNVAPLVSLPVKFGRVLDRRLEADWFGAGVALRMEKRVAKKLEKGTLTLYLVLRYLRYFIYAIVWRLTW